MRGEEREEVQERERHRGENAQCTHNTVKKAATKFVARTLIVVTYLDALRRSLFPAACMSACVFLFEGRRAVV